MSSTFLSPQTESAFTSTLGRHLAKQSSVRILFAFNPTDYRQCGVAQGRKWEKEKGFIR
jgi:hypothetical protein